MREFVDEAKIGQIGADQAQFTERQFFKRLKISYGRADKFQPFQFAQAVYAV